ncbi:MAG: phage holin family protein [Nostocales cyanobacterium]|nr:MAG: phage holin family protein [Nostocales cyanobacterium]TAF11381.1 MAG: phage holin family protein [Nostocales cyanobacterium]
MWLAFLTVLATALSLLIVDILFPGVDLANFPAAMIAGLVIGLINSFVKPVINILSLPFTLVTLGAFSLVINGFCFWLASVIVPGFRVQGIVAFIFAPIVLSLANTVMSKYFADRDMGMQRDSNE